MDSQEFTPQQYRKFNGQSIMLALDALGRSASADDLAKYIGDLIDQPQDAVKAEVSQVLRRGISNGFFQRRGKKYCLFNEGSACDVDSGSRKRKPDLSLQMVTDGRNKKVRLSRPRDNDESDVQSELSGETIDDLQGIIAKANKDTQRATVLASEAAKRAKSAATRIEEMVGNESSSQDD